MFSKYVIPLVAVLGLGFALLHAVKAQQTKPSPPPPAEPARTPFAKTIAGAGLVEATTENISIGSQVAGLIVDVSAKVGDSVKAGAPLFRLDDRQWQADLVARKAMLQAARAKLARLQAMPRTEEVPPLEAKVREAEANVTFEKNIVERTRNLVDKNALPQEDLDRRQQAYFMALEQSNKVKADLALLKAGAWESDLAVARAEVAQAQAAVAQAETELDRLLVRAPVDGEVMQVNVRPGEYVSIMQPKALMMLGDVRHVNLRVDVDEHDIFRWNPKAPAVANVRGNAREKYHLEFVRVEPFVVPKKSLTGDASERVDSRVLQVIYHVKTTDGDRRLFVGQQMDAFIDAESPTANAASR